MTNEDYKVFQFDILNLVQRYSSMGARDADMSSCLLNVAAILCVSGNQVPEFAVTTFKRLLEIAKSEMESVKSRAQELDNKSS